MEDMIGKSTHFLFGMSKRNISLFELPSLVTPPMKYAKLQYSMAVWWASAPGAFLDRWMISGIHVGLLCESVMKLKGRYHMVFSRP